MPEPEQRRIPSFARSEIAVRRIMPRIDQVAACQSEVRQLGSVQRERDRQLAARVDIAEQNIRNAVADKNVKAIVLRIDSPGGSPAAAQEIVDEIKKAQVHGVPVIISMGDTAASAAYYISAPANYIIANPSTVTGSIGVIWVFQNMSASYKANGTDYQIIKSGEMKDMGSPWRGLTDAETEYANTVVMEVYDEFVSDVSKGRNISTSDVKALADGRIYTGTRAKQLRLVDGLGDLYDAIDKAAELGGIKGEPKVEYMKKASLSNLLLGSDSG